MFPASLSTAIAVLLITTATTEGQNNTLCGTKGYFCPEEFQTQVSNRSCGKYSDVFREPNVTMQQDVVPLANYTYTNNSEVIDNTTYLSEVLQSKAYELYSDEELGLIDASSSCQSGAVKAEFAATRYNQTECNIDVSDVLASVTPIIEKKWLYLYYGRSTDHPAESCLDLFNHDPLIPSGKYWIKGSGGSRVEVYCDMDGSNCDGMGGWMRIYKLDFESSDSTFHDCPNSEFETYSGLGNDKMLCRRKGTVNVCKSAYFGVNGQSYSKVCGKAKGYQKGTTDAFYRGGGAQNQVVDGNYVDGISFTHGNNPRKHIFTLASGCSESGSCWALSRCPCQTGENPPVPNFIGHDDFYCEAASYWHPSWGVWYNEPIWDAEGCVWKETPCCSVTSKIPWFYKKLPQPTTHSVEARVCTDEPSNGEDVGFSQLEIYVK